VDTTTQLAIGAVVRGLSRSGVMNDDSVRSVMEELLALASGRRELQEGIEAKELESLAGLIGNDARIGA